MEETTATLLARIDERTERMEKQLDSINGRLRTVEQGELTCPVRNIGLPLRVQGLEKQQHEIEGAVKLAKAVGGGGGLLGFLGGLAALWNQLSK